MSGKRDDRQSAERAMLRTPRKSASLSNPCAQAQWTMTSQEKAELHFKQKQDPLTDGQSGKSDYEQRARAEREKMAKLRALRLARDAKASAD
jgi:hypothetical protein